MTCTIDRVLACLFATAALVACGDPISDDGDEEVTTFDCEGVTCDAANGEFCWYQRFPSGEIHSPTCFKPDTACTSCACAEDAIAEHLDGSSNCDSLTACAQENDAITYACDNPPI